VKKPDTDLQTDLHAAADDQIDQSDQARLDAWLADNPDDAATVHAYRLQNARLHDQYDFVLNEPVPRHLLRVLENDPSPSDSGRLTWFMGIRQLAAAVAFLLAGGVGGWVLHGQVPLAPSSIATAPASGFADAAIGAHRVFVSEVRHPVEVPASEEAHLVAWLSKRLGTTLRAPAMNDLGFSLVGGRLLADRSLPVAQFMYQDATGRRLTLYVRSVDRGTVTDAGASPLATNPLVTGSKAAFHFVEHDGVSAFYWIDADFAYALVAPVDRATLMAVATRVYAELDR